MAHFSVLILAFAAMIFWGVGDFIVQKTSKKIGNLKTLMSINLTAFIIIFPFIFRELPTLTRQNFYSIFILSIIDFAFGLTLLKAFAKGKLTVVEIIMTLELPLTVLMGMVFFKERLSPLQFFLIIIILFGVVFISKNSKNFWQKIISYFSKHTFNIEKGAVLAFTAAIISSFYNLFVAYNAREISPLMTIWLSWSISLIMLLVYYYFRNGLKLGASKIFSDVRQNKKIIIFGAVIDTLAWISYASALSRGELSITTAITESYPAIAMFLGIKFNHEKISRVQFFGAMLALGGGIVMALIS